MAIAEQSSLPVPAPAIAQAIIHTRNRGLALAIGPFDVLDLTDDGEFVLRDGDGRPQRFAGDSEREWLELQCERCGRFSRHASPVNGATCYGNDDDPSCKEAAANGTARTLERADRSTVIPPPEGELAFRGEHGVGGRAESGLLLEACGSLLTPAAWRRWRGVRVLVTAGGTREPIDSVRFVGNRSSGRMGYALAAEAARRGAEVTVVAANVALEPPLGVRVVEVRTAAELAHACQQEFADCDVLLMVAAVADFRPAAPVQRKLKKDHGVPTVELRPTDDVLSLLAGSRRPGRVIIGFAAEHGEEGIESARGKLERKRLDAVVVNDISLPGIGFDAPDNAVTILTADRGEREVPRASKPAIARAVLDEVERLRERGTERSRPTGHQVMPQEYAAFAAASIADARVHAEANTVSATTMRTRQPTAEVGSVGRRHRTAGTPKLSGASRGSRSVRAKHKRNRRVVLRTRRSGRPDDCRILALRKPAASVAPPSLALGRLAGSPAFICTPRGAGKPGLRSSLVSRAGAARDLRPAWPRCGACWSRRVLR